MTEFLTAETTPSLQTFVCANMAMRLTVILACAASVTGHGAHPRLHRAPAPACRCMLKRVPG